MKKKSKPIPSTAARTVLCSSCTSENVEEGPTERPSSLRPRSSYICHAVIVRGKDVFVCHVWLWHGEDIEGLALGFCKYAKNKLGYWLLSYCRDTLLKLTLHSSPNNVIVICFPFFLNVFFFSVLVLVVCWMAVSKTNNRLACLLKGSGFGLFFLKAFENLTTRQSVRGAEFWEVNRISQCEWQAC